MNTDNIKILAAAAADVAEDLAEAGQLDQAWQLAGFYERIMEQPILGFTVPNLGGPEIRRAWIRGRLGELRGVPEVLRMGLVAEGGDAAAGISHSLRRPSVESLGNVFSQESDR